MKDEMELVQNMESTDERDPEEYINRLESILDAKSDAVASLRSKIYSFQDYRNGFDS